MKISPEHQKDINAMPPVLRAMLEAELAAGNTILEVGHSFPAPPAGAYFKLTKPVSTRDRKSDATIGFYDRNMPSYSGEFTDAKRFYFILEPPHPPQPEPDMNAIRAEREARQRAADAKLYEEQRTRKPGRRKEKPVVHQTSPLPPKPALPRREPTLVDRFRDSMVMDYERWHDGIGYDLSLIKKATPEELVEIEEILIRGGANDWRDVEALAALNSPRAKVLLRKTLKGGKTRQATAVTEYAPDLVSEEERIATLVAALEVAKTYEGLTQTLLQVETFHPPQVIDALFCGALHRDGETAVHLAGMLMFVHGKAKSAFDWNQRPLFLRFNTQDQREREAAFVELCEKVGVKPDSYLKKR
jgi:hypothetical protein